MGKHKKINYSLKLEVKTDWKRFEDAKVEAEEKIKKDWHLIDSRFPPNKGNENFGIKKHLTIADTNKIFFGQ